MLPSTPHYRPVWLPTAWHLFPFFLDYPLEMLMMEIYLPNFFFTISTHPRQLRWWSCYINLCLMCTHPRILVHARHWFMLNFLFSLLIFILHFKIAVKTEAGFLAQVSQYGSTLYLCFTAWSMKLCGEGVELIRPIALTVSHPWVLAKTLPFYPFWNTGHNSTSYLAFSRAAVYKWSQSMGTSVLEVNWLNGWAG